MLPHPKMTRVHIGRSRVVRGFTLIEILVVVAIIALLVAILLPALKRARDQTKVMMCKANLHDFGNALYQYSADHKGYFALPSYMGCTTWYDNPGADDNLFILWFKRYSRSTASYACPATVHRVRTPERVVQVPIPGKGIEYQVFTDGVRRNDFELHAQLVTQMIQLPSVQFIEVKGFGTSYEYCGWMGTKNVTLIDWWPLNKKHAKADGEPTSPRHVRYPSNHMIMKDADEGEGSTAPGGVVNAPLGKATNNLPEPWDNHGAKLSNALYTDGHTESQGVGYWETWIRKNPLGY